MSETAHPAPEPLPLLTPPDIRSLCDALNIRPTKTLGQNFVHDAGTVRRIVKQAGIEQGERVLEIGPGLGSLTLALLETGADVTAVEIDPVLAGALPETIHSRVPDADDRFRVILRDALTLRGPESLAGVEPTCMVANLPYNVSVPVLLTVLEYFPSIERLVVMVQAEVADRIAAIPGSKIYGVPSIKVAWYGHARRTITIGRTVFWPVPNVDSALVEFTRGETPSTSVAKENIFRLIDAAFAQRRKTLRQALARTLGNTSQSEQCLVEAGIDPSARGETLVIDDFVALAESCERLGISVDGLKN
ncbi:16S rRNA (adenine(1518)-N(6)/adenine(1519)-N(6))-dimethyltransferase RsmA [Actinomyces vulturis]|uniref:16S rRNA (adenine(1518)-N(6)/adenine(1519)-N(6))- dimethyltransferase RsmA n=1 Tax=Actinomyces vulturis TaxID=1857645 RepID=UPI000833F79C|nr:16S rRNA (adenine(1518)-N(6)/adenine(1519)-N(6))-dimethyltransferase RsmA [Actinomyces vulturis]